MALKVEKREDGTGYSVVAVDNETGDWLYTVDVHESQEADPVGIMVDVYECVSSSDAGAFQLLDEETYWYDDVRESQVEIRGEEEER